MYAIQDQTYTLSNVQRHDLIHQSCSAYLVFDRIQGKSSTRLQHTMANVINGGHCYHKPMPTWRQRKERRERSKSHSVLWRCGQGVMIWLPEILLNYLMYSLACTGALHFSEEFLFHCLHQIWAEILWMKEDFMIQGNLKRDVSYVGVGRGEWKGEGEVSEYVCVRLMRTSATENTYMKEHGLPGFWAQHAREVQDHAYFDTPPTCFMFDTVSVVMASCVVFGISFGNCQASLAAFKVSVVCCRQEEFPPGNVWIKICDILMHSTHHNTCMRVLSWFTHILLWRMLVHVYMWEFTETTDEYLLQNHVIYTLWINMVCIYNYIYTPGNYIRDIRCWNCFCFQNGRAEVVADEAGEREMPMLVTYLHREKVYMVDILFAFLSILSSPYSLLVLPCSWWGLLLSKHCTGIQGVLVLPCQLYWRQSELK